MKCYHQEILVTGCGASCPASRTDGHGLWECSFTGNANVSFGDSEIPDICPLPDKADPPKNVTEIVEQYLKANGYDGLQHEDDCGCLVDDLAPCGELSLECSPGYKVVCNEDCTGHHACGWHIQPKKPEALND